MPRNPCSYVAPCPPAPPCALLAAILLCPVAHAAEEGTCPRTFTEQDLDGALDSAVKAVEQADGARFATAWAATVERLACVREPLSPRAIARVHWVQANGAVVDRQPERVAAALAGGLNADASYIEGLGLRQSEGPMAASYNDALLRAGEAASIEVGTPAQGWIEVNGRFQNAISPGRAAVFQRIDGQGQVTETAYHWPGDDLGPWTRGATRTGGGIGKTGRVALLTGAGVSALSSGILYGVALQAKKVAIDPETPSSDAVSLAVTANSLSWGAVATGGLALGLTSVAVLTW